MRNTIIHIIICLSVLFCTSPVTGWAQSSDSDSDPALALDVPKPPEDMYVDMSVSSHQVYPGETFRVDYLVYVATGRGQVFYEVTEPEFSRWYSFEGKTETSRSVVIQGKGYTREPFATYYVSAYETGNLALPGIKVQVPYLDKKPWITHQKRFIKVVPLPQPVPDGFSYGNVGHFEIKADMSQKTCHVGEIIQLNIHVVSNAAAPKIRIKPYDEAKLEGLVSYPVVRESMRESVYQEQYRSEVGFRIRFKATKPGRWQIPPVELVTFDTDLHQYRVVRSDRFEVEVTAALPGSVTSETPKIHIRRLDDAALRPIHPVTRSQYYPSLWWMICVPLLLLFFVGVVHVRRHYDKILYKVDQKEVLNTWEKKLRHAATAEIQLKIIREMISMKYRVETSVSTHSLNKKLSRIIDEAATEALMEDIRKIQLVMYSTHEPVPLEALPNVTKWLLTDNTNSGGNV